MGPGSLQDLMGGTCVLALTVDSMARTTAIKNNNDVVVSFNEATNTYTILNDINNNGNVNAGETLLTRTLQNNVQFGFSGADITDMDGNSGVIEKVQFGGSDVVTFDARGQASVSGFLFLIHNNHLTANYNGQLRGISVTQGTGSAELWEFDTGAGLTASPAVAAGKVIIGTQDGQIYAFG